MPIKSADATYEKTFPATSVFMDEDFKKTHLPLKEFELKTKSKK